MPFSRSGVEQIFYPPDFSIRHLGKVGLLGEKAADQSVQVFIGAAILGAIGSSKVASEVQLLL